MNKRLNFVSAVVAVMTSVLMTGCGSFGSLENKSALADVVTGNNNSEIALSVAFGPNANETDIPLNAKTVNDLVYDCCYSHGSVAFANVDGNSKLTFQADIPEQTVKGLSESKKKMIASEYSEQLMTELSKVKPVEPEVDTLKAISLLGKTYKNCDESADKVMVVMNSGLSTTGYLDFTKGLLNADTVDVVDALNQYEAIPDVKDVTVYWMYLGQTAAPQKELTERQKHRLQDIWESVLMAGGAKQVIFTGDVSSDKTDRGYPAVSTVYVPDEDIITEQRTEEVSSIKITPVSTTVFENETVQFVGNKAEFVDIDAATAVLKQYAEELVNYPNNTIYVVGTTATGDKDFCDNLSVERAYAVKAVLVSCGVPDAQLIPVGLGFDDYWHINDLDESGRQVEEFACHNRKVMLVDANGDDARWVVM